MKFSSPGTLLQSQSLPTSFIRMKQLLSGLCFSFGSVRREQSPLGNLRFCSRFLYLFVSGGHLMSKLFLALKKNRLPALRRQLFTSLKQYLIQLLLRQKKNIGSHDGMRLRKAGGERVENREDRSIYKKKILKSISQVYSWLHNFSSSLCFPQLFGGNDFNIYKNRIMATKPLPSFNNYKLSLSYRWIIPSIVKSITYRIMCSYIVVQSP